MKDIFSSMTRSINQLIYTHAYVQKQTIEPFDEPFFLLSCLNIWIETNVIVIERERKKRRERENGNDSSSDNNSWSSIELSFSFSFCGLYMSDKRTDALVHIKALNNVYLLIILHIFNKVCISIYTYFRWDIETVFERVIHFDLIGIHPHHQYHYLHHPVMVQV